MRKPLSLPNSLASLFAVALSACAVACVCLLAGCSQGAEEAEADRAAEESLVEQERESFIAHGSNYGKSETVSVATDLSGNVRDVAVTEWIKNPEGLETISDETKLNALIVEGEGVSYRQDEGDIVWSTGGQDVKYAGATDQELPFAISYEYKLDGETVDPSALQNAKGQLEITIRYENKTSATVVSGGTSYDVQMPYVMASIIAFDPEHARNITVDSGLVADMNGQQLAVGLGMPGLSRSLRIENQVSLPESVTIKAEVLGFDMPSVTTVVTAQGLELVGGKAGEAQDGIASLFGKVSGLQQGFAQLSSGIATMGEAVGKAQAAQSALEQQISAQVGAATAANSVTLEQHQIALNALTELDKLCTNPVSLTDGQAPDSTTEGGQATAATSCGTCDNCKKVAQARAAIAGASQSTISAQTALASLPSPENPTSQSIAVLNAGLSKLTESLGQLSSGMSQMSQATETMGEGIADMFSQAQGAVNSRLDLVEALGAYVEAQGAFCGSADGMPASTTFVVTAQAE